MTTREKSLADIEREHIERVLRDHNGNRSQTARVLGIHRTTLISKIKRYRINVNRS